MDQKRLTAAVEKSLQAEGFQRPAEVSLSLIGDADMRELNRDYRGFDKPTDVLSFSQLEEGESTVEQSNAIEGEPILLGDIVISVETAKRQADDKGHDLEAELDLLVVHGMLHLLGYDDETDEGAEQMRERENNILRQLEHGRTAG